MQIFILSTWHMVNSNRKMTGFFLFKIAVRCFFFFFLPCVIGLPFQRPKKIIIISKRIDIHCNSLKKLLSSAIAFCCRIKIERECIEFGSSAVSSSKCVCQIFYSHQEYRSVCKHVCYGYIACMLCIGCSACLSVQSALVCYVVVIVVLSLRSLTKNIYDYVAPKMYIETKITQD